MADHSEIAYTTADGNDYKEHEQTYAGFVEFAFVGTLFVIGTVLGIGIEGISSHWLLGALVIFVISPLGAIHSVATGTRGGVITSLILSVLIFAYSMLS
jgi:hypothetical protein